MGLLGVSGKDAASVEEVEGTSDEAAVPAEEPSTIELFTDFGSVGKEESKEETTRDVIDADDTDAVEEEVEDAAEEKVREIEEAVEGKIGVNEYIEDDVE